jgi:hypothetical protein
MRILLVEPCDDPVGAPWRAEQWNRVIDLGTAGSNSCEQWGELLRCPVLPAGKLENEDFDLIRAALGHGSGVLVDQHGLDWWDLIALEFHQPMEEITRLQSLVANADLSKHEVSVTRSCFQAQVLELLLGQSVTRLSSGNRIARRLRHYAGLASKLSLSQLLQILGDKYDTGYAIRRHFSRRPRKKSQPVVLLPSAYINVTRTGLQYAELLGDTDFLLVTTRPSGLVSDAPKNVRVEKLASYAAGNNSKIEFERLSARWNELKPRLIQNRLLSVLIRSGAMDSFPKFLRDGLMIRDAWLNVFEHGPVRAVMCADDANFSTRIPLLLARERSIAAVACHHGALDGRHRLRPQRDSLFLAKGRMEQDYLQRVCKVNPSEIEVGAPSRPTFPRKLQTTGRFIVFFSDQYEVLGGRANEFYRDVLPGLAELAAANNRDFAIKLHPVESLRERRRLVKSVLPPHLFRTVSFVAGPLTESLLENTWFAVTVLSTTAVDCALRGIPAFSCAWLEYSNYGYAEQLIKFGAALRLNAPDEIAAIPEKLQSFSRPDSSSLWQTIDHERFQELLSGRAPTKMAVAV